MVSALSKDNVEFEVLFVNKNKSIKTIFDLIKRFKTLDYKMIHKGTEELDIFVLQDKNQLRATIKENEILKFCKTNELEKTDISNLTLKKSIMNRLVNRNYHFNINLKSEVEYDDLNESNK